MKTRKIFALLMLSVMVLSCMSGESFAAKKKTARKKTAPAQQTEQKAPTKKADPHGYYKGLTQKQGEQADAVAREIADAVMAEGSLVTDLQKVRAASRLVARYCSQCTYGNDENRYYRTPYGVFVAGVYTCAGATRALGRVLDYMGYAWEHANENQWSHQWCILTMDGQQGFADGQVGITGYGEHP